MKFQPVVHIDDALPRAALMARVRDAAPASARLTLVCAPAGFGKTTLLAQLARHELGQGVKVGWLNCDARDADPHVFSDSVLGALQHSSATARDGASVADQVAAMMAGLADPVTLFIDDYDAAAGAEVDDIIASMALAAPPHVRIVLACRVLPGIPLTRLQLAGRVRHVEADWLRFSRDEAAALLAGCLPQQALDSVAAYTDGWPFALQLSRLRAAGTRQPDWQLPAGGSVPRRQLFDYLASEVLGGLSQASLAFLSDVAILEEIDVAAANAIRQHGNSLHLVRELAALKPVVVVDEERWSARLPPLLRDYLLHLLELRTPGRAQSLHLLAAAHYAQQGRVDDAVCHATKAGRFDLAAGMIEEAGAIRLLVTLGEARVRLLLRQLPAAMVQQRPRLRLLTIGLQVEEHEAYGAEADIARIEQQLDVAPQDGTQALRADLVLARSMMMLNDSEHQLHCAPWERLRAIVAQGRACQMDDPLFLGLVLPAELFLLHRYGPAERAERRTREVETLYEGISPLNTSPWVWMYHARNALARGELRRCEQIANESLKRDLNFIKHSQKSLGQLVTAVLGRSLYEQGRLAEARAQLSAIAPTDSVRFLEVLAGALVDSARCEYWLGNADHAVALLVSASDLAFEEDLPHLAVLAGAVRSELELRLGRAAVARQLADTLPLAWEQACVPFAAPWMVVEALARARFALCLQQGQDDAALATADTLLALAGQAGQQLGVITAHAMRAGALLRLQRPVDADAAICDALRLAQPLDARQVFIDQGAQTLAQIRDCLPRLAPALRTWAQETAQLWDALFQRRLSATDAFTERELEILRELAKDQTTKMIARTVMRSPETVKYHLKAIFSKLNVSNRDDAVREARRRALMP